jgi:hypothetical protein
VNESIDGIELDVYLRMERMRMKSEKNWKILLQRFMGAVTRVHGK